MMNSKKCCSAAYKEMSYDREKQHSDMRPTFSTGDPFSLHQSSQHLTTSTGGPAYDNDLVMVRLPQCKENNHGHKKIPSLATLPLSLTRLTHLLMTACCRPADPPLETWPLVVMLMHHVANYPPPPPLTPQPPCPIKTLVPTTARLQRPAISAHY